MQRLPVGVADESGHDGGHQVIDLLVTGGDVVSSTSTARLDVGVNDGKVVFLASPGAVDVEARRVVDASGPSDTFALIGVTLLPSGNTMRIISE